eukprot:CAMPEP_0185183182 /NCGR_PEP_ID=MMETSP1140-20130426/1815_1 /TAXON_ID=298111 /ORGANISM="Pavlova sp., Strain CCMP459" /LENGTH=86 /DNA_ID=CAMNT_0027749183 /DNA_START=57 /DNA_END=317 /DNA_ORIENTATION=+
MPTDWEEMWLVGTWFNRCRQRPQAVPEEHCATFEAAVTRSGYRQVHLATRARPSVPQSDVTPAQSAGQGYECGRVNAALVEMEEVR